MGAAERKAAKRSQRNALEILGREQSYATEMWNKTNDYNSPEQVKQRYINAGMNPYVMMSPGSSVASSSPSSPSVSPAVEQPSQRAQRVMGSLSSVQEAVQGYLGALRQSEEIGLLRNDRYRSDIDKSLYAAKALEELHSLRKDNIGKDYDNILKSITNYIADQTKGSQIQEQKANAERSQTEAYISGYMLLQTSEKAKYYGEMAQLEYMRMYQGLLNDIESGKLTAKKVISEMANNRILQSDATLREKTLNKLIEKVDYEVEALKNNRGPRDKYQAMYLLKDELEKAKRRISTSNPDSLSSSRRQDALESLRASQMVFGGK